MRENRLSKSDCSTESRGKLHSPPIIFSLFIPGEARKWVPRQGFCFLSWNSNGFSLRTWLLRAAMQVDNE